MMCYRDFTQKEEVYFPLWKCTSSSLCKWICDCYHYSFSRSSKRTLFAMYLLNSYFYSILCRFFKETSRIGAECVNAPLET